MIFSSKKIEDAVAAFSKLPGVGRKSALRMVWHLLKTDKENVTQLVNAVLAVKNETHFCKICNNIADDECCSLCNTKSRHNGQICVVENMRDVIAIESTQQYNGLYHVLGGLLSPLDGIGPDQLHIQPLLQRIDKESVHELIMALSPTIEGDTTVYYLTKLLKNCRVEITSIARGISFGGELEYADEMTLARSIAKRLPVENYVSMKGIKS